MQFHEKLNSWLIKRFGNLNKAALELDIQSIRLYKYVRAPEDDGNMPGASFLIKLRHFGCDLNWLLGGDDDSPEQKLLKEIELLRNKNDELEKEIQKGKRMVDAVRETFNTYGKKK